MLANFLFSLATYVLACVALAYIGSGAMRVLRHPPMHGTVLLAPLFALALWTVVLGAVVLAKIPIYQIGTAFWIGGAVLLIYGASSNVSRELWSHRWHFLTAAATVVLLLSGYFRYGLIDFPGSPAPDGWAYISIGQYIYDYPIGAEGGLAPLYQYASSGAETRFTASAIMAVLQPPFCTSCDTQMIAGPLLSMAAFSFATSCAYLGKRMLASPPLECLYVAICVLGGWLIGAVKANNFDNILALSYAPALVGLLLVDRKEPHLPSFWAIALLLAAAGYTYPELLPLTLLAYVLAIGNAAYLIGSYRAYAQYFGKVAIVALLLIAPYVWSLFSFFWRQLALGLRTDGVRPGQGAFPALIDPELLATALWGLNQKVLSHIISAVFLILLLFGFVRLFRQRHFSVALFAVVIGGACALMAFKYKYDYGVFKLLLFGWWAIALIALCGVQSLARSALVRLRLFATLGTILVALPAFYYWSKDSARWYRDVSTKSIQGLRDLYDLHKFTGGKAVRVNVNDAVRNAWAVYFLRNSLVRFSSFQGYMTQEHFVPLMERAAQPPDVAGTEFVLTEAGETLNAQIVWKNSEFVLWRRSDAPWVYLQSVDAPNGIERDGPMPFFWLGKAPVLVTIFAERPGIRSIEFEASPGPSVPASALPLQIKIAARQGESSVFTVERLDTHRVSFHLHAGTNVFELYPLYSGPFLSAGNGDARTLILGVRGFTLLIDD